VSQSLEWHEIQTFSTNHMTDIDKTTAKNNIKT